MAWIDWDAAPAPSMHGQLPSAAGSSASLSSRQHRRRHAVPLRQAIPGLDNRNLELLTTAIRHAAGHTPAASKPSPQPAGPADIHENSAKHPTRSEGPHRATAASPPRPGRARPAGPAAPPAAPPPSRRPPAGTGNSLSTEKSNPSPSSSSRPRQYFQSSRPRTASAACRSVRFSVNCSTVTIASCAGEIPGAPRVPYAAPNASSCTRRPAHHGPASPATPSGTPAWRSSRYRPDRLPATDAAAST